MEIMVWRCVSAHERMKPYDDARARNAGEARTPPGSIANSA